MTKKLWLFKYLRIVALSAEPSIFFLAYASACNKDEHNLERLGSLTLISRTVLTSKIIRPSLDTFSPLVLFASIFLISVGFNKVNDATLLLNKKFSLMRLWQNSIVM